MSPYHRLEKHTKTYRVLGQKVYDTLCKGDIIKLSVPFNTGNITIEAGEAFTYTESVRPLLYRVRRISNGNKYKMRASKFIARGSVFGVETWAEIEENCIWTKNR